MVHDSITAKIATRTKELRSNTMLSPREAEVAAYREQDWTLAEIAEELDLAEGTVNSMAHRINEKLNEALTTINELEDELWRCPECRKLTPDPETEGDSEYVLDIKCPHCGFVESQEGPNARFA